MSTEALPRTIAPSEVRVGDEVEVRHQVNPFYAKLWKGVVDKVNAAEFEIEDYTFTIYSRNVTVRLLSRPTPRGPAWDAPMGSLWSHGPDVYVRTELIREVPFVMFRAVTSGATAALWSDSSESIIDALLPYVSPPYEVETLRQNVIDAAVQFMETSCGARRLKDAVRALRDAESNL